MREEEDANTGRPCFMVPDVQEGTEREGHRELVKNVPVKVPT